MKINFKSFLPHLIALGIFLAISILYFHPALEGYTLKAHDVETYRGMSKELVDFRAETGEEALWTGSMFSGMPGTQISVVSNPVLSTVNRVLSLGLPHPLDKFFLTMLGFYILLLSFKVDYKIAIIGSVAYALSSYFIVIFQAGHITKSLAIAYMAPTLAGVVLLYRGKVWLGTGVFALFLGLELLSSHLQITYYLAFIVFFYVVSQFVVYVKEYKISDFIKKSALLLIAVVLAVSTNMVNLWGTIEYGKYTTRGKSDLVKPHSANQTSGLDKDYITAWSYGTGETFSLMLPFVKGGGSQPMFMLHPKQVSESALEKIGDDIVSPQMQQQTYNRIANETSYWGNQGFTSGNVYAGIIVVFFFLLAMYYVKGVTKWFLFAVMALTIMLSWGKNMMWLTDLFLDYLPGYNKFRSPSMILVVAELILPLLAMLFLNYLYQNRDDVQKNIKGFYIIFGGLVSFLFLLYLLPETFFNFFPAGQGHLTLEYLNKVQPDADDAQKMAMISYYNQEYYPMLKEIRISIFRADIFRALIFLVLSAGIIYGFVLDKIKLAGTVIAIGVLMFVDLFFIDLNYLNNDNYESDDRFWVEAINNKIPYRAFEGDYSILNQELQGNEKALKEIEQKVREARDKSEEGITQQEIDAINFGVLNKYTNFRVYAVNNPFNESRTSYFYKSLGGYHGAKLKRYQEVIDSCLSRNNMAVLNMLNAKYIVEYQYDNRRKQIGTKVQQNPNALGNAWFVKEVKFVNSANEELDALKQENGFNPANVAIVDSKFKHLIDNDFKYDSSATIKLESYAPNHLVYSYESSTPQIVVFSEIFYDLGWQAYIDDKPVEHFRANYILRGLEVPAGKHKIEFRYTLKSYDMGTKMQPLAFILILLLLGNGIYKDLFLKKK